ncbi:MAG: hypothetical protein J7513_12965 [Solirubrobacteraceae bacterium]|nr:hypothetical protein [Solirubrobacteraceae bacterium]
MRRFRRMVQTVVPAYVGAWGGNGVAWIVGAEQEALLAVIGMCVGGGIGWRASRNVAPWTPQVLRDGAIGRADRLGVPAA